MPPDDGLLATFLLVFLSEFAVNYSQRWCILTYTVGQALLFAMLILLLVNMVML